jgi:hypothetical protein
MLSTARSRENRLAPLSGKQNGQLSALSRLALYSFESQKRFAFLK